jgi:ABC-type lipoprotein export system ATPase subunit
MDRTIVCRNLDVAYRLSDGRERCVLSALQASFPPGVLTLISGETGSGKSTLLHTLAGLMRPARGEIQVEGQIVSRWLSSFRDRWRRRVGIVFQFQSLLPDLTAIENVLLPMIPRRVSLQDSRRRARQLLSMLDIDSLRNETAGTLSGGQRQRVAVARALIAEPLFLFADEPTAHQDAAGAERILSMLVQPLQRSAVVVVAAHDPRVLQSAGRLRHYRLENRQLSRLS